MEQLELKVSIREVLGKKVRSLRRQGITPLHLYGHGVQSMALQANTSALAKIITRAGTTKVISLKVDGEKRARNVILRQVDRDWRGGEPIHVDFFQVRASDRIKAEVPVTLVGEAPALKTRGGMLFQNLASLQLEGRPGQLPSSIDIDVSELAEIDQAIHVRDLAPGDDITVLAAPDEVVVKISGVPVEVVEEKVERVEVEEAPEAAAPSEEPTEK